VGQCGQQNAAVSASAPDHTGTNVVAYAFGSKQGPLEPVKQWVLCTDQEGRQHQHWPPNSFNREGESHAQTGGASNGAAGSAKEATPVATVGSAQTKGESQACARARARARAGTGTGACTCACTSTGTWACAAVR